MDHVIKRLLSEGRPIMKYAFDEYWLDIGQITDYESSGEIYDKYFREGA
jgi:NDP-sugar pyrophosphorylase family protein